MKKIFSIVFAGLAALSFVGCADSDYDEKYPDPSKTSTVGVPQVFTAVMQKGNTWMNPVYFRWYTQSPTSGTFSGVIGNSNGRGRFRGASEGYFNTRWMNFYDMLAQHRLLEYTYDNMADAEKPTAELFVHLSRALIDSQLHEMLSLWGDVPFNGAGNLWKNGDYAAAKQACVYDDDVELYKQILSELKTAGDYLAGTVNSTAVASLGRQDYTVAGGDVTIWRKYVNSLRLRIALHLVNGDCASEAKAAIKDILGNPDKYPVVDSNDENMGVNGDTSNDFFNFGKGTAQALAGRGEGAGSQAMLDAMNVPADGIPTASTDPRLPLIYDCNPDGEYIAYDVTMSDTKISNLSQEKTDEYKTRGILQANYFCCLDSVAIAGYATYQGNENLNGLWISAAEVALSKAEAYLMGYGVAADATKAKDCFVKGVKESVAYYTALKTGSSRFDGDDSGNPDRACNRPLVIPTDADAEAYANLIWDGTQKTVCTQLWLNFGFMNELEAWNVVRRTGFPTVKFAKDTQVSSYPTPPHRLPYPSNEINFNSDNFKAARDKNYTEETGYYTKLFWAKDNYYTLVQ